MTGVTTPILATTGKVMIDGTEIIGISNVKFGDKNVMKDVTVLGDLAKKNSPTIQDWSLTFDMIAQKSDAGQVKVRASKSAKTSKVYVVYISADMYYTCEGGYVETLDNTLGGAEELTKTSVTISSNGVATFTP
jgi:hypothetical protein